jgi:hypothetical protein
LLLQGKTDFFNQKGDGMKSISFIMQFFFLAFVDYVKSAVSNSRGLIGVNSPNALPTASQKIAFDTELRIKSVNPSIYTDINSRGRYDPESRKMAPGIVINIDKVTEMTGAKSGTITMLMPFDDPGVFGRNQIVGNEEQYRTKTAKVYRNNWAKPSTVPNDGVDLLDQEYLDLVGKNMDLHAVWGGEEVDLEFHQALVEQHGETLYYSDTQATCVPHLNPNIFIAGLGYNGSHPVYSTTPATYTQRVANAVWAAGNNSFDPLAKMTWSMATINNLKNFCIARGILPLPIPGVPGGMGWVVSISEQDHSYMTDPFWNAKNPGAMFMQRSQTAKDVITWTGEVGYIGPFVFVVDLRLATMLFTGSSEGSFGITTGYMWHGNRDLRNRDNTHVRNCCIVHGMGALYRWEPIKPHYANIKEDYEMYKGICSKGVRGVGQLVFDQASPTAGTHEQYASAICLTANPEYTY